MKLMTKNLAASLNKLSQSQTSCATYSLLEAPVDPIYQNSELNESQVTYRLQGVWKIFQIIQYISNIYLNILGYIYKMYNIYCKITIY